LRPGSLDLEASKTMRRRVFRMTGCLTGLLAILMIALAPTISHALAAMQDTEAACDMPSMQHEHSQAAAADLDACAYCSLLAHLPAVVTPDVVFARVTRAILHHTGTRFESVLLIEPARPGQPRAPPASAS
jgi:hypothetical protein